MTILYAFLLSIIFYITIGTILHALVEGLKTSLRSKVVILTFGQPLLTALTIWFACSTFNKEIAETGALFAVGPLINVPFSNRKYFSALIKNSDIVTIEYISELVARKTVELTTSKITDCAQSTSQSLIDKPSELIVSMSNEILKFQILDKTTKVSL